MNELSMNSKIRYNYALRKAMLITGKTINNIVQSGELSLNELKYHIANDSSVAVAITALIKATKDNPKLLTVLKHVWYPALAQTNKRIRDSMKTMSPKQCKAFIRWETVLMKLRSLSRHAHASRDHVLLAMYSLIPPRRQLDYARVHIGFHPTDSYIDLTHGIIHLTQYKTAKHMGPWSKKLPKQLLGIIRQSVASTPRRFLFEGLQGPFEDASAFAAYSNRTLARIFRKPVTVNSLRHAYAAWVSTRSDMDTDKIAADMGHSEKMHRMYVFSTNHDKK